LRKLSWLELPQESQESRELLESISLCNEGPVLP